MNQGPKRKKEKMDRCIKPIHLRQVAVNEFSSDSEEDDMLEEEDVGERQAV